MPKIVTKGGKDLVREFLKFDFRIKSQKGSHIKLSRSAASGEQILIIPDHKELKLGTLLSIVKKSREYLDEEAVQEIFFH